jgi:hypothetical protein
MNHRYSLLIGIPQAKVITSDWASLQAHVRNQATIDVAQWSQ